MEAVEVDGGEDIANVGSDHIKFGQQLHLSPRKGRIHAQLAGHGNEIFLQHLDRYHSCSPAPVLCH